jgi:uncharacterized membrane protein YgcG
VRKGPDKAWGSPKLQNGADSTSLLTLLGLFWHVVRPLLLAKIKDLTRVGGDPSCKMTAVSEPPYKHPVSRPAKDPPPHKYHPPYIYIYIHIQREREREGGGGGGGGGVGGGVGGGGGGWGGGGGGGGAPGGWCVFVCVCVCVCVI